MSISTDIARFRPTTGTSSTLLPFERTPTFDRHHTIRLERDSTLIPVIDTNVRRLKALARLNAPAALVAISNVNGRIVLDIVYHHAFHRRQMEGMLALSVHMGDKRIADVSADLPLDKGTVKSFLDDIPGEAEVAFLVLDRNGLHRMGRQELFHEGLHLFCNRKEHV